MSFIIIVAIQLEIISKILREAWNKAAFASE
jgi:hypothetical protein